LLSDVGQAIAFVLIAIGVWFYHGFVLRTDGQHSEQEQKEHLSVSAWRVVVIEREQGHFGQPLLTRLRQNLPGLSLESISLTPAAPSSPLLEGNEGERELKDDQITTQLSKADLIIAPWTIAAPNWADELVPPAVSQAIASSAAHKLLIPTRGQKWEWLGTMTDYQLAVYQCVVDLVNGIKLSQATEEYHYTDVVSVTTTSVAYREVLEELLGPFCCPTCMGYERGEARGVSSFQNPICRRSSTNHS
jgi:hypothetical protein